MPDQPTNKKCPKCGAIFGCTPHDCWCAKLPPVMPLDIDAECYCPACLNEIIAEKMNTSGDIPH